MKKAIALALAIFMCLSLIPMTALAYGNEWIQLEKENFDPGESMVVTFKGITQKMVDDRACAGWAHITNYSNNYCSMNSMWYVGENVWSYTAPIEPGEYEFHLYRSWGRDKALLVASVPFTVGAVAKEGTISLDKAAYTAMEDIIVTYSGITENMVNSNAFMVIFPKGAEHNGQHTIGGTMGVTPGSGTCTTYAPNQNGEFEMRLYTVRGEYNADTFVMSVPFTVSGATGSGWAKTELEKANELGLIPESLKGKDLTKPITRAEFAAVAVKVYEALSGAKAIPEVNNPFTDTKDIEVLKAYNLGVTAGVSATEFEPDTLLNREQCATMLARVFKRVSMSGWTIKDDANFPLKYDKPALFADDAKISDWAKDSVYFMAANNIISGVGNNTFAPRATTSDEEARGYAQATREQALIIAVRMVENLK